MLGRGGDRDRKRTALEHAPREWRGLLEVVQADAAQWIGAPEQPVDVRFVRSIDRPGSRLLVIDVVVAGAVAPQRLLAKVPLPPTFAGDMSQRQRPSLIPPTDRTVKHGFQHASLRAAYHYFDRLDDRRVAVNRVVAHLPEHHAIVVDFVRQPTLGQAVKRNRLRRNQRTKEDLPLAFSNAGLWLRTFHAAHLERILPHEVEPLRATRDDFLAAVAERVRYLSHYGRANGQLTKIMDLVEHVTLDTDDEPRRALYHGDFAPRNMFVSPTGTVTVFDIHGRWTASTYEDIAFFLTSLRTSRLHVLTDGRVSDERALQCYEAAFLSGYFRGEVPSLPTLASNRALVLLDRWAALAWHYASSSQSFNRIARPQLMRRCDSFFSQALQEVTADLTRV